MSTTLEIPAPCDWIRLNGGHGNRYARANLTSAWRNAARLHAKAQNLDPISGYPVRIEARVHLATRPSRWDATNWLPTAKACVDGLVDAGVLTDDSNRHVVGPDMRAGDRRDRAWLVITITPTGDTAP